MAHHEPVEVDPRELAHAQAVWHNFTILLKYSALSIAVVLILLALAFTG